MSHSGKDKARFVDGFVRRLRDQQFRVWYDNWSLLPGQSLIRQIFSEGVGESDVVIAVLSENTTDSDWVREELEEAMMRRLEGRCTIIPVVLDGVRLPAGLRATYAQRIADPQDYDSEFDRIVAGIHAAEQSASARAAASAARQPRHVPHALPNAPPRFVNRETEIAQLHEVLDTAVGSSRTSMVALVGMPGVGKSALGSYWANAARDRFPDGSLHIDFKPRGRSPAPDIDDIIVDLLRRLGLAKDAIPEDRHSQYLEYERLTSTRRLLVFVDNVSEHAQIRSTMPHGNGSLVVAATDRYIEETAIEATRVVPLEPLEQGDAIAMLRAVSGRDSEPHGADGLPELADLCGGLPMALAVCGAQLQRHPTWSASDLAREIRTADDPLDVLSAGRDRSLPRMFDVVYRSFDHSSRQVYRRLGLFPGPTVTSSSAAVLSGCSLSEARRILDSLHDANMLIEVSPRRYTVHNLVAIHMRSKGDAEDSNQQTDQATTDLADWYRDALRRADLAISPRRLRLKREDPAEHRVGLPSFESASDAYGWYLAERHNLVAVMERAADTGLAEHVWQMAESSWLLYTNLRMHGDWREITQLGIDAAGECSHAAAEARLRSQQARLFAETGDHGAAGREMARAKELVLATDNLSLQASVIEFDGICAFMAGRTEFSFRQLDRARTRMDELGNLRGVAIIDLLRARFHIRLAEFAEAIRAADEAHAAFESLGDRMNTAKILLLRARALVGAGHLDEAVRLLAEATVQLGELGMTYHLAQAHELLAAALTQQGRPAEARPRRQTAYRLYSELGHRDAERLESQLGSAPPDDSGDNGGGEDDEGNGA